MHRHGEKAGKHVYRAAIDFRRVDEVLVHRGHLKTFPTNVTSMPKAPVLPLYREVAFLVA